MTVNRTTLLDLPLPVTGTESGTWGDTTNNGLTQYVDIAVAGMTSLTSANFTAGALTLANTTGDSSATNIAAGSAQYGAIKVSSLATNSTITAPSSNRRYTIINADATYSVTIKASGQTGVVIAAGEKALVAFNGTDYVKIATANGTGEFTTVDTTNLEVTNIKAKDGTAAATIADSTGVVTVTAAPVLSSLTASQAVFTTAGKALTSNAITGTGNVVMSASPTLTGTISAAAATLSGNLTLSGGTANGVAYLNASKVLTTGSALTFDGTTLGVGGVPTIQGELNVFKTGAAPTLYVQGDTSNSTTQGIIRIGGASARSVSIQGYREASSNAQALRFYSYNSADLLNYEITSGGTSIWSVGGSEQMRLTSTGLGIGTSSPATRLQIGDATVSASNKITLGKTTATTESNLPTVYAGSLIASGVSVDLVLEASSTSGGIAIRTAGSTRAVLDSSGNLLLNGTSAGASAVGTLAIFNGTAPTGSVTNGIVLYAEDVSSSSELKVRDEAGNVTTLSPHNFSMIPEGPSEDMAWAYYSEKDGKRINVDMLKLARMVEKLTGEKLVYTN